MDLVNDRNNSFSFRISSMRWWTADFSVGWLLKERLRWQSFLVFLGKVTSWACLILVGVKIHFSLTGFPSAELGFVLRRVGLYVRTLFCLFFTFYVRSNLRAPYRFCVRSKPFWRQHLSQNKWLKLWFSNIFIFLNLHIGL